MLVLFDHGTPNGLASALSGHTVHTAQSRGWDALSNGALLNVAEDAGFELLLTTDQRIRYQQNLKGRRIALVEEESLLGSCDAEISAGKYSLSQFAERRCEFLSPTIDAEAVHQTPAGGESVPADLAAYRLVADSIRHRPADFREEIEIRSFSPWSLYLLRSIR